MQVKEHIQALTDENLIRVEKIGSGNWYWSFPSEVQLRKEEALNKAQEERNKIFAALEELQRKVEEASAEQENENETPVESGYGRKSLTLRQAALQKELEALRTELSSYSENDPVEIGNRRMTVLRNKEDTERWTDQIVTMESWVKAHASGEKEQFGHMKRNWYGIDFDEDEGGLKEL